ncbi:hypothetical protein [Ammoniphilus sp. 3BR4]|uniref:hypothetical protein n=1 Tax=Ammoniphilus sp. 3BR4 TaxID=3158265 RepID=UPI0034677E83
MPLRRRARRLIGRTVGVTFQDGTGVSGILCQVTTNNIFILQFITRNQFSLNRYNFNRIRDIRRFPSCPER